MLKLSVGAACVSAALCVSAAVTDKAALLRKGGWAELPECALRMVPQTGAAMAVGDRMSCVYRFELKKEIVD